VNLFCVEALRALLERCGLEVAEIGERQIDVGWTRIGVVSVLARPAFTPSTRKTYKTPS
jgi:hypothetical protein